MPGPEALERRVKRGVDVLHDPLLNKGTAFTLEERERLGLVGLVPPAVGTMELQARRVMDNLRRRAADIDRYVEMMSLLDRNTTLFFHVLIDNIVELLPIVYTPTVGQGCQRYAHIFRRARGVFLTRRERGRFGEALANWPEEDVRVIVVTDGERILGLGDLGCNGMGIPVGKLSLYVACGGVPPEQTLPVMLDVGTNNERLLEDPLYLGMRERRLTGAAYDELVDEFVAAAGARFPGVLIQFEDFANHNAFRLLERYAGRACCFNDDIQGTAAVAVAGLHSAARLTRRRIGEETLLFCGAGEAAVGIAKLAAGAMAAEGLTPEQARERCWFMDSKGLVVRGRADLQEHKQAFAHPHAHIGELAEAIRALRPTALIGVSGQGGQFARPVIEAMAAVNARPIVFALSNPTANSECTAEQAYAWSRGRAIFASGSPYAPVNWDGRTFFPGQGNNAYIFPGVGLGVIASRARRVTDEMFAAAARVLASCVSEADLEAGCLYPPLTRIREVSSRIAAAVAGAAYEQGLAEAPRPADLLAQLRSLQYEPVYR